MPDAGAGSRSARRDEIARLIEDFQAASVERKRWTHEAHLVVATWYALHCEPGEALEKVRSGIQRLNAANGVEQTRTGGYHETLTRLYMIVVRQAIAELDAARPLDETVDAVIARCGDRRLPLRFYSETTLMSWAARISWVEPDLCEPVLPDVER
jgi:hypothetical protein